MFYANNNQGFLNTTPGRGWLSDCVVSGALKNPQSALGGFHVRMANNYNQLPIDSPSGAYWAITVPGFGPLVESESILTYPITAGYGVVGSGPTSLGFQTGLQVGGGGSNWGVLRSHLSTGVAISDYDAIGLYIHRKYSGLTGVTVGTGGSYTAPPMVSFLPVPTNGYAAAGSAVMAMPGGSLSTATTSVTVTNPGGGYTSPPTVTFDPPVFGGTTATGTATIYTSGPNIGQLAGVTVTNGGSGYLTLPNITFTGGGGSGAAAMATSFSTALPLQSIAIDDPGTGYTAPPTVTLSGSGGASATATIQGNGIQAILLTYGGSGYIAGHEPAVTINDVIGGGTGATAKAAVDVSGSVTAVLVTNPGSGYIAPFVTIAPPHPGGYQGQGIIHVSNGSITGITVTDGGGPFSATPSYSISGTGTGAQLQINMFARRVNTVTVLSGGSSYADGASITFTGPTFGGTQALAQPTVGGIALAVDQDAGPVVLGGITPAPDPQNPLIPAELSVRGGLAITGGVNIGGGGAFGASMSLLGLSETTTINTSSSTTTTTLQLPAKAFIFAVAVRVLNTVNGPTSFTVTSATMPPTTFSTAPVSTAAGSTDPGTGAGVYYNATAQHVQLNFNMQPTSGGPVRVVVFYLQVTAPTA